MSMFWSQNRLLEGLPQTWCIIPGCIPFCPNEENEVTSLSIVTMSRKWVGTNTCVCSNKCAHASPCFRGLFFKRMGNWKALKTRGKLWSPGSDDTHCSCCCPKQSRSLLSYIQCHDSGRLNTVSWLPTTEYHPGSRCSVRNNELSSILSWKWGKEHECGVSLMSAS